MARTLLIQFKLNRHTAAEWAARTEIPLDGEPCWATDTHVLKIGDGSHTWNELAAANAGVTAHGALTELAYATAGHTGFSPATHTHRPARTPHGASINEVNWTANWRVIKRWSMADFYAGDFVIDVCRVTAGRAADGEWKVRVTATGIGGAADKTWDVTMAANVRTGSNAMAETVAFASYQEFSLSAMLSGDIGDDNPQDVDIELISHSA
jgi:hypothetical protein